MSSEPRSDGTFRALLRFWRNQRGMSQLDLGLSADVSARHISFLETGRSRPSVEMVGLLGEVLDVPLRSRNELLRAAGFEPNYPEPTMDELLAGPLGLAIDTMLEHTEPYPMMVIDRWYRLLRINRAGRELLALAGVDLGDEPGSEIGTNVLMILFDPELKTMLSNWDKVASQILRRLQRTALRQPDDEQLSELLATLLETPGLPDDWRAPDLSDPSEPVVPMKIDIGDISLRLLTTITAFHAPNNATLDELQIETYLPLDDATRAFFTQLSSP